MKWIQMNWISMNKFKSWWKKISGWKKDNQKKRSKEYGNRMSTFSKSFKPKDLLVDCTVQKSLLNIYPIQFQIMMISNNWLRYHTTKMTLITSTQNNYNHNYLNQICIRGLIKILRAQIRKIWILIMKIQTEKSVNCNLRNLKLNWLIIHHKNKKVQVQVRFDK